jgi:hypothetical protein
MSDKPRPWPNVAKEIRDRSAEEACRGLRALIPLLDNQTTKEEEIRRIATAINCLQTIARLLESVGAQTRP